MLKSTKPQASVPRGWMSFRHRISGPAYIVCSSAYFCFIFPVVNIWSWYFEFPYSTHYFSNIISKGANYILIACVIDWPYTVSNIPSAPSANPSRTIRSNDSSCIITGIGLASCDSGLNRVRSSESDPLYSPSDSNSNNTTSDPQSSTIDDQDSQEIIMIASSASNPEEDSGMLHLMIIFNHFATNISFFYK